MEQDPIAVRDRIMALWLPLKKNAYLSVISTYASIMSNAHEFKEEFYNQLRHGIKTIPDTDKPFIAGDYDARVGVITGVGRVIRYQGQRKFNSNGKLLLAFYSEHEVIIIDTILKYMDYPKTTGIHPRPSIGTY
ncbi:uncharacterized protein [Watersipora subatra]|uniref:uncharacterized protein n=1 Tax=Watersipora subatra TaxID=2589382 RepID=UPI00355C966B